MPDFPLSNVEKQSVGNASQLIRDAGWPEKADRVDDFLAKGQIVAGTEASSVFVEGRASKTRIEILTVGLNPPYLAVPGTTDKPLTRSDPEIIRLAAVLLHEADHTMCHGEIEAYGEMIPFGQALVRKLDELFRGLSAEEKAKRQAEAEKISQWGRDGRDGQVAKEPPAPPPPPPPPPAPGKVKVEAAHIELPGFGSGRLLSPERAWVEYPAPSATRVELHMDEIATALVAYRDRTGTYPRGGNAAMVKAIRDLAPAAVAKRLLDRRGCVVDPWGRPYVYRAPGRIHPDHFDLYSTGPSGRDQGGRGDNVVCMLRRL